MHQIGLAGASRILPILIGHLEGHFHGGRTVVRVKHLIQTGRGDLNQFAGELHGGRIGETQKCGMRHTIDLFLERAIDYRLAVTVHGNPQAGDPVQIAVAVGVDQLVAVCPVDDQRLVGDPIAHLGKRMPDMRLIQALQTGRPGNPARPAQLLQMEMLPARRRHLPGILRRQVRYAAQDRDIAELPDGRRIGLVGNGRLFPTRLIENHTGNLQSVLMCALYGHQGVIDRPQTRQRHDDNPRV